MKIKRALVSVFDKTGLDKLASIFKNGDIEVLSTGGTAKLLKSYGVHVTDVSDYTGFPEMMDGRVKTLHPKIHGGLLAVRSDARHIEDARKNNIEFIDLVVVNLYPFEETVKNGASFEEIIENIDIGGPSMIRSAAKNHEFTTVITSPNDYDQFVDEMHKNNGSLSSNFRKKMAEKAFHTTAKYDTAISKWFAKKRYGIIPRSTKYLSNLEPELTLWREPTPKGSLLFD